MTTVAVNMNTTKPTDLQVVLEAMTHAVMIVQKERDDALKACAEMLDVMEFGWTIIANASGGNWTKETKEWQDSAARFREQYHHALSSDYGKDYFHVRELERTKKVLEFLRDEADYADVEEEVRVVNVIRDELARLEALKETK